MSYHQTCLSSDENRCRLPRMIDSWYTIASSRRVHSNCHTLTVSVMCRATSEVHRHFFIARNLSYADVLRVQSAHITPLDRHEASPFM